MIADNPIYVRVRVLPVLAICPPWALPKTTSKSDARLRDVAEVAIERAGMSNLNEGQALTYDVVSERGKLAASNLQNV